MNLLEMAKTFPARMWLRMVQAKVVLTKKPRRKPTPLRNSSPLIKAPRKRKRIQPVKRKKEKVHQNRLGPLMVYHHQELVVLLLDQELAVLYLRQVALVHLLAALQLLAAVQLRQALFIRMLQAESPCKLCQLHIHRLPRPQRYMLLRQHRL